MGRETAEEILAALANTRCPRCGSIAPVFYSEETYAGCPSCWRMVVVANCRVNRNHCGEDYAEPYAYGIRCCGQPIEKKIVRAATDSELTNLLNRSWTEIERSRAYLTYRMKLLHLRRAK